MEIKDRIRNNRKVLSENYRLALKRELFKQSFFDFFKEAVYAIRPNDHWQFNWHHEYLCNVLQKESQRINRNEPRQQDLLINCPPSVTKSTLVSVCFNAWVWGCVNPHHSFISISHSDELAIELASVTKDLIDSVWYKTLFPNVVIKQDSTAKSNFKNTFGGQRISLSMLAGLTGFHSDYILIDDFIDSKNVSDIKLETAIRIYRETIHNRLSNPRVGLRLLIGQRVSDNDLYNFLLSKNTDNRYLHICLPIEKTADVSPQELNEYYDKNGGVLWKERFPVESFSDLTDSSQVFSTQYLQSPKNISGSIVKDHWFDIVDGSPLSDNIMFIDPAYTSKKTNDPSAILIAGIRDNIIYIKHSGQYWLEFPDLLRKIKELSVVYNTKKVLVEPKASGKSIVQQLRSETQLSIIELPIVNDSKSARLNSIAPKLESKRVKLVKGNWNENFIYEVTTFPNGKHDDQLDCLMYAVDHFLKESGKIYYYM